MCSSLQAMQEILERFFGVFNLAPRVSVQRRLVRLETERLVLRKPELGDLDGYVELWGDPK